MILACVPVEKMEVKPGEWFFYEPSDGAIKDKCAACGTDIWVGVKQQAFKEDHPEAAIACFKCAIMSASEIAKLHGAKSIPIGQLGGGTAKGAFFTD